MTWVTVSSMVCAEAPGQDAVTMACGSAISGNWATGSRQKARAPASITRMAHTHATMGRRTKNGEMSMLTLLPLAGLAPDEAPVAGMLQPFHEQEFAFLQPVRDHPHPVMRRLQVHMPLLQTEETFPLGHEP